MAVLALIPHLQYLLYFLLPVTTQPFFPSSHSLSLSLAWKGSLRKIMWFFCFDGCFSAIKDMVGSSRVGLGWIADSFTIWL